VTHTRRFLPKVLIRASWALLWAISPAGCTTDEIVMQTRLPGARAAANLSLEAERGEYLDVTMESGGTRYRFFLPDNAACRSLFAGARAVTYANTGIFGHLQADADACDPIGILSLREWRNRRPHRGSAAVIPRDQAQLRRRIYVDDEVTLIRGRFRLAVQLGLMGGEDIIAVLPNAAECEGLTVPGTASMEFRPAGAKAFSLVNAKQLCPVIGFVLPDSSPAP